MTVTDAPGPPARPGDSDRGGLAARRATQDDAEGITRIYSEGIRERGATFETRARTPPTW